MNESKWLREFPADYDVPKYFGEDDQLTDASWHNDACPSFHHKTLPVMVWTDHPDPNMREIGPDMKRFAVCGIDQGPCLLETDDWRSVREFFHKLRGIVLHEPTTDIGARRSEVWYARPEAVEEHTYHAELGRTHVLVAISTDMDLDAVFGAMQGERWSPNGEARDYIKGLGLQHTSMSVGDIVVQYGDIPEGSFTAPCIGTYICKDIGWEKLP